MMKNNKKRRIKLLMLAAIMLITVSIPTAGFAAATTVNLRSTSTYAVAAGTTITNTGATTINGSAGGNVALHPGSAFPGQALASISGTVSLGDATALAVKNDLILVYDEAAGNIPFTMIGQELAGQTLAPGIYRSPTGAFQINGTLTLDAGGDPDGVFIFQTVTSLITGTGSSVVLTDSARFCRVFWQIGSDVTLGVNSDFKGHIFALNSIAALTGATIQGQLLARNGAVTLDSNTITNGVCLPPAILLTKTALPLALPAGPGPVTYTYTVTNPGTVPLSAITVVDDKITPVNYISGDTNLDSLLQAGETWIYRTTRTLNTTTTNTAIASGTAGIVTVTSVALATVIVTPAVVIPPVAPPPAPVYPPLINVVKTAAPLALPGGSGSVTYTYKVTNPGLVQLSDITITDDKISQLTFISGDTNNDSRLQSYETWTYQAVRTLTETTTNTVTVRGSANGMTATDIAYATVVVTPPIVAPPIETLYPPIINVVKTPSPLALSAGEGLITYTYKVTNPGLISLTSVSVTDDKIANVAYVAGDTNHDGRLQVYETWTYTASQTLTGTTTNTATAQGTANNMIASDLSIATVVVTEAETETGGQLPDTATIWYNMLLVGAILILLGSGIYIWRKRNLHE